MQAVGTLIYVVAGIATWFFMASAIIDWVGIFFGVILSLIFSPGVVIFPIVYWIAEGAFPITYFAIWGIGLLGLFIASTND